MYKLKLGKSNISYDLIKKIIDNLPDDKEVKKKQQKSKENIEHELEELRTKHIWEID